MKSENINELIDRYWAGETTLAEDQQLREYHRMGLLEDAPELELLGYFEHLQGQKSTREVEPKVISRPTVSLFSKWRPLLMGIAAAITLLMAALLAWPQQNNHKEITDPQEALEVTYAALSILNKSIDDSKNSIRETLPLVEKTQIHKIL